MVKKTTYIPTYNVKNIFKYARNKRCHIPLFHEVTPAKSTVLTDDQMKEKIDLNQILIKKPSTTFFLKVSGSSMIKAGIKHNDILIIDRSIAPTHEKIVVAVINQEFTIKKLLIQGENMQLVSESDFYEPVDVTPDMKLLIWGVATGIIHCL